MPVRQQQGSGFYAFNFETRVVQLGGYVQLINEQLILAHGLLMMIAFGVVYTAGMLVARYLPRSYALWFWIHAACGSLGLALVVAGLVVAIVMVANAGQPQWNLASRTSGAHAVLGIIVVAWALLQGVVGALSKAIWQSEFRRTATLPEVKVFPDMVHWWSGRALLVVAFVNVFLGLYEWGIPTGWLGLWGGWCVLVCVAVALLEWRKRTVAREKTADIRYTASLARASLSLHSSLYYSKAAIPLQAGSPPSVGPIAVSPVALAVPASPAAAVAAPPAQVARSAPALEEVSVKRLSATAVPVLASGTSPELVKSYNADSPQTLTMMSAPGADFTSPDLYVTVTTLDPELRADTPDLHVPVATPSDTEDSATGTLRPNAPPPSTSATLRGPVSDEDEDENSGSSAVADAAQVEADLMSTEESRSLVRAGGVWAGCGV